MLADWYISDPHFGHRNIISTFGIKCREFKTVDEHDEFLIAMWNNRVSPTEKVLILGDFAFQCATKIDEIAPRLNGRKVLIKGNHDVGKLSTYARYFEDVHAAREEYIRGKKKILLSHYPVHVSQLTGRYFLNVHGHLHMNEVLRRRRVEGKLITEADPRYINVCCEHINMAPISHAELMVKVEKAMDDSYGEVWRAGDGAKV